MGVKPRIALLLLATACLLTLFVDFVIGQLSRGPRASDLAQEAPSDLASPEATGARETSPGRSREIPNA